VTYIRKIFLHLNFIIPPLLSAPVTNLSDYDNISALYYNIHYLVGDGLYRIKVSSMQNTRQSFTTVLQRIHFLLCSVYAWSSGV